MTDQEIFAKLSELRDRKVAACLATIVDTAGSTPRETGAKMLICVDGTAYGSIGGGCGERTVRSAALRSMLASKEPQLLEVDLTDDLGTRGGDVCGGKMWVFVDPI
jgi:xanthine dehydrogenase accessory factor